MKKHLLLFGLTLSLTLGLHSQTFTAVSYNCENLFDIRHDTLKNDREFLPESERHWTFSRYWRKVNDVGRVILQTGGKGEEWRLPDIVGLVEVENDSVMQTLTRRSMLRGAEYRYVITDSPDARGVDAALLYNSLTCRMLHSEGVSIPKVEGQRRTRDILYAHLAVRGDDTLHVFVVHFPSRAGGQRTTESYRLLAADILASRIDSIQHSHSAQGNSSPAHILVMGDFNDYSHNRSITRLLSTGLSEPSASAVGLYHPAEVVGTYRFQQQWESLDHIFVSSGIAAKQCYIYDDEWLLDVSNAGDHRPRRTYLGNFYQGGVSDHLPLVLRFEIVNKR